MEIFSQLSNDHYVDPTDLSGMLVTHNSTHSRVAQDVLSKSKKIKSGGMLPGFKIEINHSRLYKSNGK